MRKATLSLLVAALMFASPPSITTNQHCEQTQTQPQTTTTIRSFWAVAMSPAADLTAAAAAAVVRRNVISGAAIFTVGDAAAQMLTNNSKAKAKQLAEKLMEKAVAITIPLTERDSGSDSDSDSDSEEEATLERRTIIQPNRQKTKTPKTILAKTVASLDINRLSTSMILGAIWSGFCVPFIYGNVEKTFPGKGDLRQILTKVLVTCSLLSTIGNYATMFARRAIAQYTTYQFDKTSSLRLKWFSKPIESMLLFLAILKGCFKSCNRDILEVIVDDLKIWPLYDLTCYSIISPAWRPITTSIMSSGWAMYMSVVSAKEAQDEDEVEWSAKVSSSSSSKPIQIASIVSTIEPLPIPAVSELETKLDAKPSPAIQVTPLDLFPKPPSASAIIASSNSETTKRLIGVTGGEASNITAASPSPPLYRNMDDNGDKETTCKP
jgi:hypothetical protein